MGKDGMGKEGRRGRRKEEGRVNGEWGLWDWGLWEGMR